MVKPRIRPGTGVLLLALLAAAVVGIPMGLGSALPREHDAERTVHLPASPEVVYATLADVAAWPTWMPSIGPVRPAGTDRAGHPRFATRADERRRLDYVLVEASPPRRVVIRIDATPRRLEATWTFTIAPEGDGTRLVLHERGGMDSPILRFVMRYLTGYDVALVGVERALVQKLAPAAPDAHSPGT